MKRKDSTIEKQDENEEKKKKTENIESQDFSPILDKNSVQEKTRLENLKSVRSQTQEFLNVAKNNLLNILYSESLKKEIGEFLDQQNILIDDNGDLGKSTKNELKLINLDEKIVKNNKRISQFFKKIKENSDYGKFDIETVEQILMGLAQSLEQWKEKYTKQAVKKEDWLFLRPYVEQQIINMDENIKKIIIDIAKKVHSLVQDHYEGLNFSEKEKEKKHPTCFISYAWPDIVRHPDEWWTQKFILQFTLDLRAMGINAKMDLLHSRYGHDSNSYMLKGVKEDDFVIVIGTKSLYSKYSDENIFGSAIRKELNAIINRISEAKKNKTGDRTFFIRLSGDMKESIPEDFHKYTVIESFHDDSYLKTLKETINVMYKQNEEDDENRLYQKYWEDTEKEGSLKPLVKGLDMKSIQYHYQQSLAIENKENKKHEESSLSLVDNLLKKN